MWPGWRPISTSNWPSRPQHWGRSSGRSCLSPFGNAVARVSEATPGKRKIRMSLRSCGLQDPQGLMIGDRSLEAHAGLDEGLRQVEHGLQRVQLLRVGHRLPYTDIAHD